MMTVLSVSVLNKNPNDTNHMSSTHSSSMKLTSTAFTDSGVIPVKYTCDGEGINPPLHISGVPDGAKSLVLIIDDPDALSGVWDHWVLFNMDPKTEDIGEDSVPGGSIIGSNTSGKNSYESICPPSGTHRYIFTLYALSIVLSLSEGSSKSAVVAGMNGDVMAIAELTGRYSR